MKTEQESMKEYVKKMIEGNVKCSQIQETPTENMELSLAENYAKENGRKLNKNL